MRTTQGPLGSDHYRKMYTHQNRLRRRWRDQRSNRRCHPDLTNAKAVEAEGFFEAEDPVDLNLRAW